MSQVMMTTTTPHVSIVCFSALTMTLAITIASTFVRLAVGSSEHDVVLPIIDPRGQNEECFQP